MCKINLADEQATLNLGQQLADACFAPCLIFLKGELGAGKTTFVRGFLRGLGYKGTVKSPTYTLVEPYIIQNKSIFHFDFYRLDAHELESIGIHDYFFEPAIWLIEWPERGKNQLPLADIICSIHVMLQGDRYVEIQAGTVVGHQLIKKLHVN